MVSILPTKLRTLFSKVRICFKNLSCMSEVFFCRLQHHHVMNLLITMPRSEPNQVLAAFDVSLRSSPNKMQTIFLINTSCHHFKVAIKHRIYGHYFIQNIFKNCSRVLQLNFIFYSIIIQKIFRKIVLRVYHFLTLMR